MAASLCFLCGEISHLVKRYNKGVLEPVYKVRQKTQKGWEPLDSRV